MPTYCVSQRGDRSVEVEGPNWIAALGAGLDRLGATSAIERLACEVLANGAVIARDIGSGVGYIVREVGTPEISGEEDGGQAIEMGDDVPDFVDLSGELEPIGRGTDDASLAALLETIGFAVDDRAAWRRALSVALDLVPCEGGAVILKTHDGGLSFLDARGPHSGRLHGLHMPRGTGLVGFCMDRRASIVVNDVTNDPRFYKTMDSLTGATTRSILCTSIALDDASFGVIELINAPEGEPFTRPSLELVEMVAATLAVRLSETPVSR